MAEQQLKRYKDAPQPHNSPKLNPEWTASMKRGNPMYKGKEVGQRVVGRRRDPDGSENEVSVPHIPFERWVDPAGNVVPLSVSNSRDITEFNEKYRSFMRRSMAAAGGFPFDLDVVNQLGQYRLGLIDEGQEQIGEKDWEAFRLKRIEQMRAQHAKDQSRFLAANIGQVVHDKELRDAVKKIVELEAGRRDGKPSSK